jgi:nucleoside phosphorylase
MTLDKELTEARKNLKVEAREHDMLCAAIGVVCDDLGVA